MQNQNTLGIMLDCSRNAVYTVETVKRYIDLLEKMGYNMLMLYTEDTYEISTEPYFGYLRGRYSVDELKEIVAYGKAHGIELIPCIQTLAHLNQIFHWNEYGEINDIHDILLIDDEKTYALIEKMIKTCREAFESEKIHIGMDEAHCVGLGKYFNKHGATDRFELLSRHLGRVVELTKKYNFKPIMWSDMFFNLASGSGYYIKDPKIISTDIARLIPDEIELVYWDYYTSNEDGYNTMIEAHRRLEHPIWFAGGAWKWEGFTPHNDASILRTGVAMKCCFERDVKNVFITLWGDNGDECSPFAIMPALFFSAECYRGNNDIEDIKAKFEQLFGIGFDDFCLLDLPTKIAPNSTENINNPDKFMLYNDPLLGHNDAFARDFPNGAELYAQYRDTLSAHTDGPYGYIFDSAAALCDLLTVKYDLGLKLRAAYKSGNREEMENMLAVIDTALEKLEVFHDKFYTLWMNECKGHGFDVQDLRLGGLRARLLTAKISVAEYLDGKRDRIYELEEEILPISNFDPHRQNIWALNASANVV